MITCNIENIKTNLPYLKHLRENADIVCLQEHWLHRFEENDVIDMIGSRNFHMKCFDDDDPVSPSVRPRGQGGVMAIWRDDMPCQVSPMQDGSSRVQILRIDYTPKPLYLINTYMPTTGSADAYSESLDQVFELIQKFSQEGYIIWLGDLNGSFHRSNQTDNDRSLRIFCRENDFMPTVSDQPTYHHFTGGITSRIDHILVRNREKHIVKDQSITARHPLNTSSHDPVAANIVIPNQSGNNIRKEEGRCQHEASKLRPNWKKINIQHYQQLTQQRLQVLLDHGGLDLPVNVLVDRVYNILTESADILSPSPAKRRRKGRYPWLHDYLPLVKEIKHLFWKWKNEGRCKESALYRKIKERKKVLRSMQRQNEAAKRDDLMRKVTTATYEDKKLMFSIIRSQRSTRSSLPDTMNFKEPVSHPVDGWADYYEDLAADKPYHSFDSQYLVEMRKKYHTIALMNMNHDPPSPVTEEDIQNHLKSLKINKAADVFGMTAEHLKYAAPSLIRILTKITNAVMESGVIPDRFKVGAVAPVHKTGKPLNEPDAYRRVTISSTIGKVVEKEVMKRTKEVTVERQAKLQYGFTSGCSPALCSLIITEAIAEAKDNKCPLYLTFLDASKAFDMVNHTILLNALHDASIDPYLFNIYKEMYTNVKSRIRAYGVLSREISEERGIRQGGETSSEVFKVKDNRFLERVREHPASYKIGTTSVGIPTVADDNCMIADSSLNAQTQLLMARDNSDKDRYIYNKTKSKVMLAGCRNGMEDPVLFFGDVNIESTQEEKHLGIVRTADGSSNKAVQERIQAGRRAAYSLMGVGFHGTNGVSAEVSRVLVSVFVEPCILYGLETLCLTEKNLGEIDKVHKNMLRQLQSLPRSTATPAVYLLVGAMPLRATIHQRMLNLYITILHREGTPEYQILQRQLAMKTSTSNSWTVKLREVLQMYNLPSAGDLMRNPPERNEWKATVKTAVRRHWDEDLKRRAATMTSLKFLNLQTCQIGRVHPAWQCGTDPWRVSMAITKVLLLVRRYPLAAEPCSGSGSDECQVCKQESETVEHFLLYCKPLATHRRLDIITAIAGTYGISGQRDMVQFIIDPSSFIQESEDISRAESVTRRYVYALHNGRCLALGQGTAKVADLKRGMALARASKW